MGARGLLYHAGMPPDPSAFLRACAENLTHTLQPNARIKQLADNSEVIGAFAEASVREMVRRAAHPLMICTGAVVDVEVEPKDVPQLDTIVWSPSPLPALFTAGDFGLVPRSSCFGILEIKRTAYSGVAEKIAERAELAPRLIADIAKDLRAAKPEEGGIPDIPYFLGVVCLGEGKDIAAIRELEQNGDAIVLLRQHEGQLVPDTAAVHKLMNFLVGARLRWLHRVGTDFVRMGAITP